MAAGSAAIGNQSLVTSRPALCSRSCSSRRRRQPDRGDRQPGADDVAASAALEQLLQLKAPVAGSRRSATRRRRRRGQRGLELLLQLKAPAAAGRVAGSAAIGNQVLTTSRTAPLGNQAPAARGEMAPAVGRG
ncbi:hypothetical protein ACFSR7_05710 [Cohnella sp. GCM10020058]|uniref:hypothetical protein n=1 Tax=Cohnella sp. GCM10020058 TaxID=3317330 RepID=UPI003645B56C